MIPEKQVETMKVIAEKIGMSLSDFIRNACLNKEDFAVFGSKNYNDICSFLKNNFSSIEKNIRQIESRHNLDSDVWDRYNSFRQSVRKRFLELRRKAKIDMPKCNGGEKKRLFLMVSEDEYNIIKDHKSEIISRLERPVFVYDVDAGNWEILQQIINRVGKEVNQIAYLSNSGRWNQITMNERLRDVLHSI